MDQAFNEVAADEPIRASDQGPSFPGNSLTLQFSACTPKLSVLPDVDPILGYWKGTHRFVAVQAFLKECRKGEMGILRDSLEQMRFENVYARVDGPRPAGFLPKPHHSFPLKVNDPIGHGVKVLVTTHRGTKPTGLVECEHLPYVDLSEEVSVQNNQRMFGSLPGGGREHRPFPKEPTPSGSPLCNRGTGRSQNDLQ